MDNETIEGLLMLKEGGVSDEGEKEMREERREVVRELVQEYVVATTSVPQAVKRKSRRVMRLTCVLYPYVCDAMHVER